MRRNSGWWMTVIVCVIVRTVTAASVPEQATKLFERGNDFANKGSLPRAKGEYLKALQAYPEFKDALYNVAVVCEQLNQRDEAMGYYRRYLELSPKSADVWTQLGVLQDRAGNSKEAEASYRKAIEGDPKFGRAHHNLGVWLNEQGKLDEAQRELELFLKLEESAGRKTGDAYYSLGVLHLKRGRVKDAKMLLQKALDVDPSVTWYNNAMGDTYLAEKSPDVACVYYRKAIEKDPKYALAYSGLGDAFHALGKTKEADENYRKALQLRADYDIIHYKLGLLYERSNPGEAIKHFENYLKSGTTLEHRDEVNAKLTVLKQAQKLSQP